MAVDLSNIVNIPGTECVGDSRSRLNTYFETLKNSVEELQPHSLSAITFQDSPTIDLNYSSSLYLLSGDVINNSITNQKLSTVASATIKGRITTGTGNVEDLNGQNVRDIIQIQQSQVAKAYVNFNGSTATTTSSMTPVRKSLNITGVSRTAIGDYTINFTSGTFSDANYCAVITTNSSFGTAFVCPFITTQNQNSLRINVGRFDPTTGFLTVPTTDPTTINILIFSN